MKRKPGEYNWGAGIALGVGVGVALGAALNNIAIGIALGISMGMAFSAALATSEKKKDSPNLPDQEQPSEDAPLAEDESLNDD